MFRMTNAVLRSIESEIMGEFLSKLPRDVPADSDRFYKMFEPFEHPLTGEPVQSLTEYQRAAWKDMADYDHVIQIKGQKIGLSTLACMKVIQVAQSWGMGGQILVVAQSKKKAGELLSMIKRLYKNSVYRDYVLYQRMPYDRDLPRGIRTSGYKIYLRNPERPSRPTEIIACSITSPASLGSFPAVRFVYASDICLANMRPAKLADSMALLSSRLANTQGSMVIETPPGKAQGYIWETCQQMVEAGSGRYAKMKPGPAMTKRQYWVRSLPSRLAVEAGIIDEQYLDYLMRATKNAPVYYECAFDKSRTPGARAEWIKSFMEMIGA